MYVIEKKIACKLKDFPSIRHESKIKSSVENISLQ